MTPTGIEGFFQKTRTAKKIMVLDLGFLGDTIHLLPALWMVRQAYPDAKLHVAVAAQVTSLMDCVPWVDRVWGYSRYPRRATWRENWRMIGSLRKEKFDLLINLNGSDRSSWLTFFSGARERLGRVPQDGGPLFWHQMFTAHVQYPYGQETAFLQRCRCLEKVGIPFSMPEFRVSFTPEDLSSSQISAADAGTYFHISPFTTADHKELSPAQLAELIVALTRRFPEKKLAISCAPVEREQKKMTELLALLPQKPWRVFAGSLSLTQIAAVIQKSAVHFCGDTGTLHLAVMTGTPTVVWFWPSPNLREWVPTGEKYRVIMGANKADERFLGGIATTEIIRASQSLLVGDEAEKITP